MRTSPLIILSAILLVQTACTIDLPFQRQNPRNNDADQSNPQQTRGDRDLETCRRSADDTMGSDATIDPADEHTANPMVLARREQLRSQYQTLVNQCMGNPR